MSPDFCAIKSVIISARKMLYAVGWIFGGGDSAAVLSSLTFVFAALTLAFSFRFRRTAFRFSDRSLAAAFAAAFTAAVCSFLAAACSGVNVWRVDKPGFAAAESYQSSLIKADVLTPLTIHLASHHFSSMQAASFCKALAAILLVVSVVSSAPAPGMRQFDRLGWMDPKANFQKMT